jgi:hypothetical protein
MPAIHAGITGDPKSSLDFAQVVKPIAGKVIPENRARCDGTTPANIQNTTSMAGMPDRPLQRTRITMRETLA